MDQRRALQKINQLLTAVKTMSTVLDQQKYIITDLIMKTRFLESKTNSTEEEYNAFKKTFVSKLNEYRESVKNGTVQPSAVGSDVNDGENSGQELPREKSK